MDLINFSHDRVDTISRVRGSIRVAYKWIDLQPFYKFELLVRRNSFGPNSGGWSRIENYSMRISIKKIMVLNENKR